jgi:hypothetical protein
MSDRTERAGRWHETVKVATYQAPLLPAGSMNAIPLIRSRVEQCEDERIEMLCCREAISEGSRTTATKGPGL